MRFKSLAQAAMGVLVVGALALLTPSADACTTFRLQSQDGAWIIGRSMEFGLDLKSEVMLVPRGHAFTALRPDHQKGHTWNGKHGFLGINALGLDYAVDGMNEAGLTIGALFLPGFAEYQPFPADGKHAISNLDVPNWVLSQFATVDEVREALAKMVVYDLVMPQAGGPMPLHWAIRDAQGGSIVVEYLGGKLHLHDNPIGVMTNSPSFAWHLTNLRNYINLTNLNVDALKLGSVTIEPIGQGTGLLGLPGDYTPPSRFVKTAALAYSAVPVANALDGVNLAFHILNAVDIPRGAVAEKSPAKASGAPGVDYDVTEWVTVYDLRNRHAYFRTYGDFTIRQVDLNKVDFGGKAIQHIPMPTRMRAEDVTAQAK